MTRHRIPPQHGYRIAGVGDSRGKNVVGSTTVDDQPGLRVSHTATSAAREKIDFDVQLHGIRVP